MTQINLVMEDDNTLAAPPLRRFAPGGLTRYLDHLYHVEQNPALREDGAHFRIIQLNPSSANLGARPIWVEASEAPTGRALLQWHNACIGALFPEVLRGNAEVDVVENVIRDTLMWHEGRQTAVVNAQMLHMGLRNAVGGADLEPLSQAELTRRIQENPQVHAFFDRMMASSREIDNQTRLVGAEMVTRLQTLGLQSDLITRQPALERLQEGQLYGASLMASGLLNDRGEPLLPDTVTQHIRAAMASHAQVPMGILSQCYTLNAPELPMAIAVIRDSARRLLDLRTPMTTTRSSQG